MNYVLIKDGLVVNRIDGAPPASWPDDYKAKWVQSDEAQIGWGYDGSVFTKPADHPDNSPGPFYHYDKKLGQWVEDTEAKAEDTRKQTFRDNLDLTQARALLNTKTNAEILQWVQNNPQKALAVALMLHIGAV